MRHAEVGRRLLLEGSNVRPEDEYAGVEHLGEPLLQLRYRGAYCARTSTRGIRGTLIESRGTPAEHEVAETDNEQPDDRVFDVAERVVEALPVLADGPADPGERRGTTASSP